MTEFDCPHVQSLKRVRDQRRHEKIVWAFDEAWRPTDGPPNFQEILKRERLLPPNNKTASLRTAVLIDLALTDLEKRIEAGKPTDVVRHYVQPYPEVTQCLPCLQDLFRREYQARRSSEATLTFPKYLQEVLPDEQKDLRDRLARTAEVSTQDWPANPKERYERDDEFGPYRIVQWMGGGGEGQVYKAEERANGSIVALKLIERQAFLGPSQIRRFHRVVRFMKGLAGAPGVVRIFNSGEVGSYFFIAMELLDGGSLAGKKNCSPVEAAQVLREVALALAAVHRHGIIHRDLKPENVLFHRGQPVVTDFGLAVRTDSSTRGTSYGRAVGTPPYMAPEQVRGPDSEIEVRTDVYGMGAILYFLLTGSPPFKGKDHLEILHGVLHGKLIPPAEARPELATPDNKPLLDLCERCLAKEKAYRPKDALELACALTRFLHGRLPERPLTFGQRCWEFMARRPLVTGLLAAVTALGLTAIPFVLWLIERHANPENNRIDFKAPISIARVSRFSDLTTRPLPTDTKAKREELGRRLWQKWIQPGAEEETTSGKVVVIQTDADTFKGPCHPFYVRLALASEDLNDLARINQGLAFLVRPDDMIERQLSFVVHTGDTEAERRNEMNTNDLLVTGANKGLVLMIITYVTAMDPRNKEKVERFQQVDWYDNQNTKFRIVTCGTRPCSLSP